MFGYYSGSYSAVGTSIMAMFVKIVGKVNYSEMYDANPSMAPMILFPFAIVFFFVLLNMFVAIVMSSYEILRNSTQLKTEANARIAEEEGATWTKKLMNFVFCTAPESKDDQKEDEEDGRGTFALIQSCG